MRPTAYRRNARGLRDRQAFERVRLQAGALFAAGRSQTEVTHQLGVSRQNASRWHACWRVGGRNALRSAGPTGHAPRLSDPQLADLKQALRRGARAQGFDTDHWTLARIATVIQRLTGIGYHPGHVWKLLRYRLGWRLQRPARRAIERDEQAIARWVEVDWPRIRQNARRRRARLVFWDESGGLAAACDPPDLGTPRSHPPGASPLQMEASVDGGRAVLRVGRGAGVRRARADPRLRCVTGTTQAVQAAHPCTVSARCRAGLASARLVDDWCQPCVAAESMCPRYGAHAMPVTPRPSNRNTWPAWGWRSRAASSSPARAVVTNSVASSAPPKAHDVG
jgi:transposase